MQIDFRVPHPALAAGVNQIWHYQGYELPHAWERIMPSTGTTLLVNLADDELRWRPLGGQTRRLRGLGFCGPQPAPFEIDTFQQQFIMGVEFHAGGAAVVLGIAVNEIAGAHVSLADLLGRQAAALYGRLVDADCATRRFDILETWLLDRWSKAKMRPGLAAAAFPLLDRMTVAQTAAAVGVSPKRFIQSFRTEVGLTPKRFCRVRRFERLLQAIDTRANVHWPSLGLDHGYYDQAHLVHEFRSLSGYSPGEYLARRGPYARHVPLAE